MGMIGIYRRSDAGLLGSVEGGCKVDVGLALRRWREKWSNDASTKAIQKPSVQVSTSVTAPSRLVSSVSE
jgi:hypothetical protein